MPQNITLFWLFSNVSKYKNHSYLLGCTITGGGPDLSHRFADLLWSNYVTTARSIRPARSCPSSASSLPCASHLPEFNRRHPSLVQGHRPYSFFSTLPCLFPSCHFSPPPLGSQALWECSYLKAGALPEQPLNSLSLKGCMHPCLTSLESLLRCHLLKARPPPATIFKHAHQLLFQVASLSPSLFSCAHGTHHILTYCVFFLFLNCQIPCTTPPNTRMQVPWG